jgi:DNA-binding response OmpR family regulator
MARVLVLDRESEGRRFACHALGAAGFDADGADIETVAAIARLSAYDLVLVDPEFDNGGASPVLEHLLSAGPIVIVVSRVADPQLKVRCFQQGVGDYVVKPLHISELVARVRARLRDRVAVEELAEAPGVVLDPYRRTAVIEGRPVHFSQREFVLLQHLVRHRGRVCTRKALLSEVWGFPLDSGSNIVNVYISRLRAKLGDERIETVRPAGYRLAEDV